MPRQKARFAALEVSDDSDTTVPDYSSARPVQRSLVPMVVIRKVGTRKELETQ
jgi:hypothetical protein